jgi:D-inositol-3-phosphate glycosyltransferase
MFHTLGAMKNSVARSDEETESGGRIAIERRLMREVDTVIAATRLDKAQMVWNYGADPERIRVVPCGVDLRRFQPMERSVARAQLGLPADTIQLLCVGRMEPLKGMDALIRALALLRAEGRPWANRLCVLLVGGDTEAQPQGWNAEQRRLDVLRRELGVREQVRFLGAQPQELLPAFFAAADLVAVPSHYESFGMVALEAMASGAAVVASNAGGLALTVEDGRSGLLFPPDDHVALAAQIARLLDEPELAAALRTGARRRAADYSWSNVARRITAIYANVLELRAAERTTLRPFA